jgi:hypothetical protein
LVWLNSPTAYSFVMISPNLLAIWVFLFLNLSQDLKLVLLGPWAMANYCRAVTKSLRGTVGVEYFLAHTQSVEKNQNGE